MPKPDVIKILEEMSSCVDRWHNEDCATPTHDLSGLAGVVMDQCGFNYLLWHEEDKARMQDVEDAVIVRVKRSIDALNQKRNDTIEKVDEVILSQLASEGVSVSEDTPFNTETPGSVLDRLSIAVLRRYHLAEEMERDDVDQEHIEKARASVSRVDEQKGDLAHSLEELLNDIFSGRKQLKIYRQFKMYNDPALNPALYKQ